MKVSSFGEARRALGATAVLGFALFAAGCSSGSGNGGGGAGMGSGGGGGGGGATGFSCTSSGNPGAMVGVPGGDFMMGCNDAVDATCEEDEKPSRTVTLAGFEIDETEVTQDQYAACVHAGACEEPSCGWNCDATNLPASCLNWGAAKAYCAWAGKRLPTEAEWEKAARGPEGRKYPWGNDEPNCGLTNMAGCSGGAALVGSLPAGASPYGALDMSGNMVEMVADWYDAGYYATAPTADPQGPSNGDTYVGRGGGFKSTSEWHRASGRDWYDLEDSGASLGFRCAR